jgi:acyl carrier protein
MSSDNRKIEGQIVAVFRSVFSDSIEKPQVAERDMTPDWDSLKHVQLVFGLEEEFGVEFTPEEIAEIKSFADAIGMVKRKCQ